MTDTGTRPAATPEAADPTCDYDDRAGDNCSRAWKWVITMPIADEPGQAAPVRRACQNHLASMLLAAHHDYEQRMTAPIFAVRRW